MTDAFWLLIAVSLVFLSSFRISVGANRHSCSFHDDFGHYKVSWRYDPSSRLVDFQLQAQQEHLEEPDFWTGIGFGDNMLNADFIVVLVHKGEVRFGDMHLKSDTYTRPFTDSVDNLKNTTGAFVGGTVFANFSRPIESSDPHDKSLRDCMTFQFPISGGRITRGKMQMHTKTPIRKQVCDIITSCSKGSSKSQNTIGKFVSNAINTPFEGPNAELQNFPIPNSNTGNNGFNFRVPPTPLGNLKVDGNHDFGGSPSAGSGNQRTSSIENGQPEANFKVLPDGLRSNQGFPPSITDTKPSEDAGMPIRSDVPPGCQFHADGYSASWLYNPKTNKVEFQLSVDIKKGNFWTGIGFGQQMSNADFIIVTSINGRIDTSDRHANELNYGHAEPNMDFKDDLDYLGSTVSNGKLNVTVAKPLDERDEQDSPVEDANLRQPGVKAGCQYFQFPVKGGSLTPEGRMVYHSETPMRRLVCGSSQCVPGGPGSKISEVAYLPEVPAGKIPKIPPETTERSVVRTLTEEREMVLPQPPSFGNDCPENDHPLCDLYFDDYFFKIREWSSNNAFNPENQIPKACSLVRDLQGGLVTRACCRSFKIRCSHIEEFEEKS